MNHNMYVYGSKNLLNFLLILSILSLVEVVDGVVLLGFIHARCE